MAWLGKPWLTVVQCVAVVPVGGLSLFGTVSAGKGYFRFRNSSPAVCLKVPFARGDASELVDINISMY